MNSKLNFNQIKEKSNLNLFNFQNIQLGKLCDNKPINLNLSGMVNDISTTDTDLSLKNNLFNIFEKKESESHVFLKNSDEFVNELFKIYGEENCLCNYLLFEKNVNIKNDIDKEMKKISLSDYFECFNKAGILSINIPFLEKKGKIVHNIFNPTLSSMILMVKSNKIIDENMYKKYLKKNFIVYSLPNNLIKIEFDEANPPYYRDTLDSKIKIIHKIIGKKRIALNDIIKEKSYFSILWTPADTYKINSSLLSFYSFDFKLIGSLIIKKNDKLWFTCFSNINNNYKNFKKDYINKVNIIENFIKNYYQDKKTILSNDYKHYIYNS